MPYVVAFLATLSTGIIWYVLKDMKTAIVSLTDKVEIRQKAIEAAIDRVTRAILLLVITYPASTEAAVNQAKAVGKEVDDAERNRDKA